MRTDGVFTERHVTIRQKFGTPLKLIPFGDIHHDSPAFSEAEFDRFLKRARSLRNVMFLGMGDYFDSYSTSERDTMESGKLHDSTRKRNEKDAEIRIDRLAKKIQFMRGHMIGLLSGNHFVRFNDGSTSDMHLAQKLGTVYLGVCSAIRLSFRHPNSEAAVCCDIFAHHGKGGGVTACGKFVAVEKLANVCEADILLMGDNHARGAFPIGDRLYIKSVRNNPCCVRAKTRWLGRTGSFLRAYVPNEPGYIVDRALPPANLGWIEFDITPIRRRIGDEDFNELRIETHY